MYLHPRTQPANIAISQLKLDIYRLVEASGITLAEEGRLWAELLGDVQRSHLRAERHDHDEDNKADEACEIPTCPGFRSEVAP